MTRERRRSVRSAVRLAIQKAVITNSAIPARGSPRAASCASPLIQSFMPSILASLRSVDCASAVAPIHFGILRKTCAQRDTLARTSRAGAGRTAATTAWNSTLLAPTRGQDRSAAAALFRSAPTRGIVRGESEHIPAARDSTLSPLPRRPAPQCPVRCRHRGQAPEVAHQDLHRLGEQAAVLVAERLLPQMGEKRFDRHLPVSRAVVGDVQAEAAARARPDPLWSSPRSVARRDGNTA